MLKDLKLRSLTTDSKLSLLILLWILDKIVMMILFLMFQWVGTLPKPWWILAKQNPHSCLLMKRKSPEDRLKKYMDHKYNQSNITTLLNMVQSVVKENEELKNRLAIVEQILHMHLPIIE